MSTSAGIMGLKVRKLCFNTYVVVVYQLQHAVYNISEFEHGPPEASSTSFSSIVPTILNQLRVPTSSEMICKWKVCVCVFNPLHKGARKKKHMFSITIP